MFGVITTLSSDHKLLLVDPQELAEVADKRDVRL